MTVKILGLARLQKKLERMPKVAKEAIQAAMAAQADEIIAMMKSLAPVDDGDLRDSIGWTFGKKPRYAQAMATMKASMAGDLTITIYAGNSKVRYAHLVEFGTKPHSIEPKNAKALGPGGKYGVHVDHPGSKAQPFFYVSYRANKKKTKSAINRAVNKAAKEVAGGG